MKALGLVVTLALGVCVQVQAQPNQQTQTSPCALAAKQVVENMYRGSFLNDLRSSLTVAQPVVDENTDLAYKVRIHKVSVTEESSMVETYDYKVVAKGSQNACEIISARKLAN